MVINRSTPKYLSINSALQRIFFVSKMPRPCCSCLPLLFGKKKEEEEEEEVANLLAYDQAKLRKFEERRHNHRKRTTRPELEQETFKSPNVAHDQPVKTSAKVQVLNKGEKTVPGEERLVRPPALPEKKRKSELSGAAPTSLRRKEKRSWKKSNRNDDIMSFFFSMAQPLFK